jgi:hypothetical protein
LAQLPAPRSTSVIAEPIAAPIAAPCAAKMAASVRVG